MGGLQGSSGTFSNWKEEAAYMMGEEVFLSFFFSSFFLFSFRDGISSLNLYLTYTIL